MFANWSDVRNDCAGRAHDGNARAATHAVRADALFVRVEREELRHAHAYRKSLTERIVRCLVLLQITGSCLLFMLRGASLFGCLEKIQFVDSKMRELSWAKVWVFSFVFIVS